ncbi:D-xylulose reductase [Methanobrevibacter cuticularis]|uniref:D-xylulose reductase n=1 Tax=Methanobrevibacter cuticularis TaxID=47311 RepID=A0A166DZY3_9EURY|nr:zinc-binding dehydrogenase [Methanobrevibacter cuticularis]KZX16129.1 D-xylulose reductase [Methanobrevibacter cuticularis]
MINTIYRLVAPKLFEEGYEEVFLEDNVVIRPTHLSICQADQRYYNGSRDPGILAKKLPLVLIHECIGEVIKDNTETFSSGDMVVIIPNTPTEYDHIISENYLKSSKFRSSDFNGFMQDYIISSPDRLIKLPLNINKKVASFTELVSVSVHAITKFSKISHNRKNIIGVWGDGNLGYITSLLLTVFFPDSKVIVFGTNDEKLNMFSFVDKTFKINEIPSGLTVDHAFECVGGRKSQIAINQIIDYIEPEGTVSILGVSEYPIQINTRMILEKGISVFGSSRSGKEDFINTMRIFKNHPIILSYLENIISNVFKIRYLTDINEAFERDFNSNFGKTILIWDK